MSFSFKENTHQASKLNKLWLAKKHIAQVPSSEVTLPLAHLSRLVSQIIGTFQHGPFAAIDDSLVHNLSKDEPSEVLQDIQTQDYQNDLLNAQPLTSSLSTSTAKISAS